MDLSFLGITDQNIPSMDMTKIRNIDGVRTLIYDGDAACYVVCASTNRLSTAQTRFEQDVLTKMFLAKCQSARVHLTPQGCAKNGRLRLIAAKPYQGNRVGQTKNPLVDPLRDSLPECFKDHPMFTIHSHYDIEADDACIIDAYAFKRDGVLVSYDKDLSLNPYSTYNVDTGLFEQLSEGNTYGWFERREIISPVTGKAKHKCYGKGTKFFFAQLLMGDTADNIKGILKYNGKLCGEAGAASILEGVNTAQDAANLIIDGYRKINQNVIPEAYALWLLRTTDDHVLSYLRSLELSSENQDFLEDCNQRKWMM